MGDRQRQFISRPDDAAGRWVIIYTGAQYGVELKNRSQTMNLSGKKVIALGERDGVQGNAIAQCASSAGADVVLEMTHCFV